MLKRILLSLTLVLAGAMLSLQPVEAKRLGGGGSIGMQRSVPQRQAMPPATTTRPQQTQPPATAPQPQAQPSGWRRWAGPLAGLAAGIGLAALLSHFGVGGDFAGILLLVVGVMIVFALLRRMFASRQPQPAYAEGADWQQAAPMQYESTGGSSIAAPAFPADFDVDAFVHQAKVNFIRLQAANDAGNLEDIREFTSPEMFAEIKLDVDGRRGAAQKTDVVSLDAQVLEVSEEPQRYVASVRYHGLLREESNAAPAPFDEVWHLTKPRDGNRGWTLAGIQQVA